MNYEMMRLFVGAMMTTIASSFITVIAILSMVLDTGNSNKKKLRLPWKKKAEQDSEGKN